ncbi:sulfate transporter family protein [Methylopila musalis]|uniref:Sulfate transporter family protein n=1 Tax=Methylopila musalis TaxID=1134781 RepID=A0ABW3ZB04_9HYPH
MLDSALMAARQMFSPEFRAVLLKSLGLTLLALALGWIGLQALIDHLLTLEPGYLRSGAQILSGLGLAFGLVFLITPVTAAVAGLFLDDVAAVVERTHYPADAPGVAPPTLRGALMSARFGALVLAVNVAMLPLLFFPGVNVAAWALVNAYLLSREYFTLAALRFRPEGEAAALRRRHRWRVFAAGLVAAALALAPLANLLTPLFATAFFVHLHKKIAADDARRLARRPAPERLGAS